MVAQNTVTMAERVVEMKKLGLRNCQIVRALNVSRQYVSRVCRSQGYGRKLLLKSDDKSNDSKYLATAAASLVLGVSVGTMRRWADEGKVPCFRIEIGRKDRRFHCSDLERLKRIIKS